MPSSPTVISRRGSLRRRLHWPELYVWASSFILYDDNDISIEGNTDIAFAENVAQRFQAYGWHVIGPSDGMDAASVDSAIRMAQAETGRPQPDHLQDGHWLWESQQGGQCIGPRGTLGGRGGEAG